MRKRERGELLIESFTWCHGGDALRKQATKNGFLRVVNDVNGRSECRVD